MTVEAMRVGQVVLVQDSRRPASAGGQLQAWALLEWAELLRAVRLRGPAPVGVSSEFFGHVAVDVIGLEELLLGLDRHEKLRFNFAEWNAFVAGVLHGEFEPDALDVPARCESSSSAIRVGPEEEEAGAVLRGGAPAEVAAGVCGVGAVTPAPVAADLDSPAGRDHSREAVEGSPDAVATTGQPGAEPPAETIPGKRGRGSDADVQPEGVRTAESPGWRPDAATGAGGVGATSSRPAPVAELNSPAGRPRDASTGEVVLSPADRPGSDAAGTGASPGPVPAAPAEPPSRSLVLFERQVDMEVWFRDDAIAAEAFGSHDDDRWFKCGDYDADPMCWENVLRANKDVWPSLLTRSDMAPLVPTDGAS
jgi:hypothetical protein